MAVLIEENFPEEGPDYRALFTRLLAMRWWIVGSICLFAGVFCAVAFLTTPVYRATTVLAPAAAARGADVTGLASGQLGGLAAFTGLGLGSRDGEIEEALAVLRSRQFTESFIAGNKLMPKLFASKWDPVAGSWKVDAEHQPTPAKAYKYFDTKIRSIAQDKKTGLVTVAIDWTDRKEAAAWANDLVRLLNEEMRARAIAKADASMRFLEKEMQTTSTTEVRDAVSRLMETQVKQRMLANVTQDYSFRVVDRAMPADADDPVKPKKLALVAAGPLVGLVLAILGVLVSDRLRLRQAATQLASASRREHAAEPTAFGN